jgi:tetrahydromethanopterin S-methyltransferase subunit B
MLRLDPRAVILAPTAPLLSGSPSRDQVYVMAAGFARATTEAM